MPVRQREKSGRDRKIGQGAFRHWIALPFVPPHPPQMDVMTLTGNLLAEWTFDVESTEAGQTHRAQSMSFQVGGKGINVARVLGRLGGSVQSVGFASGPLADYCREWLEAQQVDQLLLPLVDAVRPGLVVREGSRETTFLGVDASVPASSWRSACQQVMVQRPRWLAVCGSIPGWKATWTRSISQLLEMPKPVKIAVDTYGPPLKDLLNLPLDLVKINRRELEAALEPAKGESLEQTLIQARKIFPVKNWIITDGPEPITVSLADGGTWSVKPARIREISPTGSGDTFLAALLHKWPDNNQWEEALAFAAGCATANAASAEIADFPLPLPDRFKPDVQQLGT